MLIISTYIFVQQLTPGWQQRKHQRSAWGNPVMFAQWGRVTHICIRKLTIIGSENGLASGRRQAINWTNAGVLWIGPLGTNFRGILVVIHAFSFKKTHFKMSSGKWRPFCPGLNVFKTVSTSRPWCYYHQYARPRFDGVQDKYVPADTMFVCIHCRTFSPMLTPLIANLGKMCCLLAGEIALSMSKANNYLIYTSIYFDNISRYKNGLISFALFSTLE